MEKFCVHCGSKLVEGQLCLCQQEPGATPLAPTMAENPTMQLSQENPVSNQPLDLNDAMEQISALQKKLSESGVPNTKAFFTDNFKNARGFLRTPVEVMRRLCREANVFVGLFFVGVNALAMVFSILYMLSTFMIILGNLSYVLTGEDNSYLLNDYEIYYAEIGAQLALVNLGGFFLYGAVIWGTGKLLAKSSAKFKPLLVGLSVASLPMSASFLLAILLIKLNMMLAMAALIVGFMMNQLLNAIATREALQISENQTMTVYPVAFIVNLALVMLLLQAFLS